MSLHSKLGIKKYPKRETVSITGTLQEFRILFGRAGEKAYIMAALNNKKLDIDGSIIHDIKKVL